MIFKSFMIAALLSVSLAEVILYLFHLIDYQEDMSIGLAFGLITHVIGFRVFRKSMAYPAQKFIGIVVGCIIIRLFLLIIFLVLVLVGGFLQLKPVVIGLLAAYFTGSLNEITWLVLNKDGGLCQSDTGFKDNGRNIGGDG